jgi:hypothetical protein
MTFRLFQSVNSISIVLWWQDSSRDCTKTGKSPGANRYVVFERGLEEEARSRELSESPTLIILWSVTRQHRLLGCNSGQWAYTGDHTGIDSFSGSPCTNTIQKKTWSPLFALEPNLHDSLIPPLPRQLHHGLLDNGIVFTSSRDTVAVFLFLKITVGCRPIPFLGFAFLFRVGQPHFLWIAIRLFDWLL